MLTIILFCVLWSIGGFEAEIYQELDYGTKAILLMIAAASDLNIIFGNRK